jgi:threonine dehydrogenase-like Zn-dependent dehydrogenase
MEDPTTVHRERKEPMKAAVFSGPGALGITELDVPTPGPGEVLLRVRGCGVCGTDAHIFRGDITNAVPPVVLGHEILGEVVETGSSVNGFGAGDLVAVDPFIFCSTCDFCRESEYRFCLNERFIGYHRTGGFCQYTTAPAANLYPLPGETDIRHGIMVEPLATVVAGMKRLCPEPGQSALILGAGTVGLLWCQLLKQCSVMLIQTEIVPGRRDRACTLGADRALLVSEERLEEAVYELFPHGVDCIVDATGSTEAVQQALPLIKRGGTFMSFGICPQEERLRLSLHWFYQKQVRFMTSRRPPCEMKPAIDLLGAGLVDIEPIVTSVYPLEEIEETFRRFFDDREHEVKMAVDPWLEV